jgi:DNA-directed RNA polymerase specialized sigma24 family protein
MTDRELIAAYVREGSQEAFRTLVARHLDMVYGRALRATRNAAMAEDVTQAVFIVLTKRAAHLPNPQLLPAWLLRVTDYCAADARRSATRRSRHEQEAAAMNRRPPP